MIFSIIIPSFNQEKYIGKTLENVIGFKRIAAQHNIEVEILLLDSESNEEVQKIISVYKSQIDYLEIKKDKGQYDAINKGIAKCKGTYWTWLNTDDYIEIEGFLKLYEIVIKKPEIDYIYGSINYINENDKFIFLLQSKKLTFERLVHRVPGIFQSGSFFKTSFTNQIGFLKPYQCCFDYEYVLRCFKSNAVTYCCDFVLASFRYYDASKTGKMIPVFIREQLAISKGYGRKPFDFLTWFSHLRLIKHKLLPRK